MAKKTYLFWFANEHLDFRIHEITSILSLFRLEMKWIDEPMDDPFWIVELDSEESARKIASRSVTLRYIMELWAQASEVGELHEKLRKLPPDITKPFSSPDISFKIKVETFCNSQTQAEKVNKIESFDYLPLRGPVRLKNPDLALQFIEYFGLNPNHTPEKPHQVFFGRVVAEGQRDLITRLSLKKRKFIGNTSMDPQLSLIMGNQAQISDGDLVLDPFVGTGSLLIAAAQYGGYVLGTDIDYLMLHGKSRPTRKQQRDKPRNNESVLCNMEQYGLSDRYVDMVVADTSLPLWRANLTLDAIVTDPPYGIREAMERVGCSREAVSIKEEYLNSHIPSKVQYKMKQMMADLLSFSVRHLRLGGRLVSWIPVIRSEYDERDLPRHECLELIANSEQILSTASSRRLLTYVKVKEIGSKDSSRTEDQLILDDETFREKYFKQVEELRRERKAKVQQNLGRESTSSER